ncbi:MAG: DUF6519 domain-containing protein [Actinomycetota bacterium]|nr:DUF6519 domain-containing protein [Actinomycetota bacterium]
MPGDYTRVSFDPRDDYSGVLLEQGRVTLDADVNEQVDLVDRRLRAEVVDTLARGVISRETPNAFLLAVAAGAVTIAPGRALVHGLLAENHGAPPIEFDPVLGEQRGTTPIAYAAQPYLPDAATLAPLPTTGTHLAYLDVWPREVSCLEDPKIVEQAIAVDTTTRRQTAWQVRFVDAQDADTCASPNPAYDAATAPSDGRLSTAAVGVPASTDPCTISPFGGYRGLENRLYRVEIHDSGPLGTATFKWSRDNASLGASVLGINAGGTTLTLSRLGRDGVKRIAVGDWVEVTDDHHELHGLQGELRQVTSVDDVRAEVTFGVALTVGAFNATDAGRHTRVIRWDQAGPGVDAAGGTVAVPAAGSVPLEDGIEVTFDVAIAGGRFHVGDHWEFAARTADASVEVLVTEPPRGILHHHMKLGVVSFPGTVSDCRPTPSSDEDCDCGCECDVCVTPESHASGQLTIQAAVNEVRGTGGKVCLQVGVYRVDAPVLVAGASSVHIQGKGWRTIILAPQGSPAFVVARSIGVTIDLLTVIAATVARRGQTGLGIAIALRTTVGTIIERCVLLQLGALEQDPPSCQNPCQPVPPTDPCPPEALRPFLGRERLLTDLRAPFGPIALGGPLIALDGFVIETRILDNVLVGATGIGALGADFGEPVATGTWSPGSLTHNSPWDATERASYLLTLQLLIEDNLFITWLTGVSLEGFTLHQGETRIRGSSILGCVRAGVACTGIVGAASRVDIAGNLIRVLGVGIAFGGDDTRVADNDVRLLAGLAEPCKEGSLATLGSMMTRGGGLLAASIGRIAAYLRLFGGDGIVFVPGLRPAGIDRAQVRGNRVTEVLGDAIALRTRVVSALITGNSVERVGGGGVVMSDSSSADELIIDGNQLLDVGRFGSWERDEFGVGVMLLNTLDAVVTGNQIRRVAVDAPESIVVRAGVLALSVAMLRVSSNSIFEVGAALFRGVAVGVGVLGGFERADVLDNTIRRAPTGRDEQGINDAWLAIAILGGGHEPEGVDPALEALTSLRASVFATGPTNTFNIQEGAGRVVMFDLQRSSVGVRGNVADAFGRTPSILLMTAAECVLGENRVTLDTPSESDAAIRAFVGAAVVSANLVNARRGVRAIDLQLLGGGPFTMLGNVTNGSIDVNNSPLAAPWDVLNN